jgi:hypothetical protein
VSRSFNESGGLVWNAPKTWQRRSVPFPAALAPEPAILMVGEGRDDLVFTPHARGVLRNSNYRARVVESVVKKRQNSDDTRPSVTDYDLRHLAASLAVSAGANVRQCARIGGLQLAPRDAGKLASYDACHARLPCGKSGFRKSWYPRPMVRLGCGYHMRPVRAPCTRPCTRPRARKFPSHCGASVLVLDGA